MWFKPAVLVVDGDDSFGPRGVVNPNRGIAGATSNIWVNCEYVGQAYYWSKETDEEYASPRIRDVYVINILYEEDQNTVQVPVFFEGKEITVYEKDELKVSLRPAVRKGEGKWTIE